MSKTWPRGGAATERWRKPLTKIAGWVPVDMLLAWIDTESGGIPTTTTHLGERGLFQVHPDEVEFLKLTPDEFQRLTTDTNLALQIGVRQLRMFALQARRALRAVGQEWHGRDFWKLVKLYHGAFGMPGVALAAYQRTYGTGPATWRAFSDFVIGEAKAGRDLIPGNPAGSRLLRQLTPGIMANAEKTGEISELPQQDPTTVATVNDLLRSVGAMI